MKGFPASGRRLTLLVLSLSAAVGSLTAVAQVKTNVPGVVGGARQASVERITIHGAAPEDNLEGGTVDCQAIVYRYGIANSFEIHPGPHTGDVAAHFQQHVMPFSSRMRAAG